MMSDSDIGDDNSYSILMYRNDAILGGILFENTWIALYRYNSIHTLGFYPVFLSLISTLYFCILWFLNLHCSQIANPDSLYSILCKGRNARRLDWELIHMITYLRFSCWDSI